MLDGFQVIGQLFAGYTQVFYGTLKVIGCFFIMQEQADRRMGIAQTVIDPVACALHFLRESGGIAGCIIQFCNGRLQVGEDGGIRHQLISQAARLTKAGGIILQVADDPLAACRSYL